MKVLVTGHEGYIGSVLVPFFEAAGHEVHGLDTGWFASCILPGQEESRSPRSLTVRRDLRAVRASTMSPGTTPSCILAALSNDPLGNLNPELTHEINYRASFPARRAGS